MLLLILAIAAADPPAPTLDGDVRADGFTWTEQSVTWTEIPEPDPEGVMPPIKGLQPAVAEVRQPQPIRSRSFDREALEAERKVDDALRRAKEAVDRAGEAVRAADAKR